jgi:Chaperone for flagella basal body P-ring formation
MIRRCVRNCLAWTVISGSSLASATGGPNKTDTAPGCAGYAAVRHAIESALLTHGESPNGRLQWNSVRCSVPVSERAAFVVAQVHRDPFLHTLDFRLKCVPAEACLPFLVSVPVVPGSEEESATGIGRGTNVSAPGAHRQAAARDAESQQSALVVPGQRMTLLWENGSVRITQKVICLDRGRAGEEVRTRPFGRGRVVRARVVNSEYVKAIS